MNIIKLLANRQARSRNDFARKDSCECADQTPPAKFVSVGSGASATVLVNTQTIPVKMMSNGWVSPTTIAPVIISGGKGYYGRMPKGQT